MLPIKTILHPTDFSPQSEIAYQVACALARDYGARLMVLHVQQPSMMVMGEFGALPPSPEETEEVLRARLDQMQPAAIYVERFLAQGEPASEILRLARDTDANIIVLGTHGRSGFGRLVMGSIAEKVVRKAPCLVLTVKAPLVEMPRETAAEPVAATV